MQVEQMHIYTLVYLRVRRDFKSKRISTLCTFGCESSEKAAVSCKRSVVQLLCFSLPMQTITARNSAVKPFSLATVFSAMRANPRRHRTHKLFNLRATRWYAFLVVSTR